MLSLTTDRLDYGDQLRSPVGYTFDKGIATTYSLDLDALIAASVALNLDQTLEGDLSGEKIALLESLDCLQSRLAIFYQRGNVKVPANFNRLFTLLEPMLAPTFAIEGAKGAFASFHPKVWVLRFAPVDDKKPVRVRLLVLSRNLSFDRSWDLAVCLDGVVLKRGGNGDLRLQTFLRSLRATGNHGDVVEDLCATLNAVEWSLPEDFNVAAVEMLPGFARTAEKEPQMPFELDERIDELLIVSPFVDAGADSLLQDLGKRTTGTKTIISRGDTLDAIGEASFKGWDVRSLSDRVVDGEERLQKEAPEQQGLHAKLIVAKLGKRAIWHVGSANMTNAAFGRKGNDLGPRNTEFMLRLTGYDKRVGPAVLLNEWAASNAFAEHLFGTAIDAPADRDPALRQLIHQLVSAMWTLHAVEGEDSSFSIRLSVDRMPSLPPGSEVTVGLLCRASAKELAPTLNWDRLKLTDVSAFMAVEVQAKGVRHRFAIQAAFTVELFELRKQAVFRETVDTTEKLLRYLTLLLDAGATKSHWSRADGKGDEHDVFGLDGRGGLYEQLLRSASRAPERLARALHVFERMRSAEIPIPDGLLELISGFLPIKETK